jgi:hypothetical protein
MVGHTSRASAWFQKGLWLVDVDQAQSDIIVLSTLPL